VDKLGRMEAKETVESAVVRLEMLVVSSMNAYGCWNIDVDVVELKWFEDVGYC